MIEVKNLSKNYGTFKAVDQLSFTVNEGEIYGFLGPNGAGKSTTMNIICGCLSASEGTVTINGYDIFEEDKQAKKCIGYLPEIPPLYPNLTPYEYLMFVIEAKGVKKEERENQVNKVIEITRIEDVKNKLIKYLSKGYKQRVGIAQALLGNPKVIVLDEPTVGLDPKQIIEIRELIKELGKNHTVILSSHILSEVQAICDKIMIISKGKLVACDSSSNLEKMFNSTVTIEITCMNNEEKVSKILKEFKDIKNYEVIDNSELLKLKIEFLSDNEIEIAQQLSMRFSKEELPIIQMKTIKASLEEIFIELCGGEKDDSGI